MPAELPIPPLVQSSEETHELLRIWMADGSIVTTMNMALGSDPNVWGLLLADSARHMARALERQFQVSPLEALRKITAMMVDAMRVDELALQPMLHPAIQPEKAGKPN